MQNASLHTAEIAGFGGAAPSANAGAAKVIPAPNNPETVATAIPAGVSIAYTIMPLLFLDKLIPYPVRCHTLLHRSPRLPCAAKPTPAGLVPEAAHGQIRASTGASAL